MLEPEYFNDKADRMLEIYRQLEDFILRDIAGRLLASQSVSGTADRLIWKLQQMGESRTEIMNKLSKLTGLSRRELQSLLQDAVMTSWDDDLSTFNRLGIEIINPLENAVVQAVMDAEYKKSQGELENLTRTAMNQANQDLVRMLDEAEIRVASGAQSYSSAICDILDNYAGKGLVIEYPTGTKRTLEAAVRMCVVTSMNQTSAQITNQYIVEGNIEYVLVSAHLGARPQQTGQPYLAGHENWQGKVYKIRGSEPGFPNLLEMTGYDIGNDGKGKVVNPLGLHGYNCRHSHKPWDKTLRNPYVDENGNLKIDAKENRKLYEAQQKKRTMERAIRKTKRELLIKQEEINGVAETDVKEILQSEYDKLSYKLRQQNAAYNDFCEKNDLQKQSDRLKVAGFKRQQAAKANGRARAYEHWKTKQTEIKAVVDGDRVINKRKSVVNSDKDGIINAEVDELTPCLRRMRDNKIVDTGVFEISPTKKEFGDWEFDWTVPEKNGYKVYEIKAEGDYRTQGMVALKPEAKNCAVHVDIVEAAPFNNPHNPLFTTKQYSGVGGHLFAEAVKQSYGYGFDGYVYFRAKSDLVKYYEEVLGATLINPKDRTMVIDERSAKILYDRYYGKK